MEGGVFLVERVGRGSRYVVDASNAASWSENETRL